MKRLRLLAVLLISALMLQTAQIPGVTSFTAYAVEDTQGEGQQETPADTQEDAETSDPAEEVIPPEEEIPAEGEATPPGESTGGTGEEETPGGTPQDGSDEETVPADGNDGTGDGEDVVPADDGDGTGEGEDNTPAENADLPEGIKGMPEGYRLTAKEREHKLDAKAREAAGNIGNLVEGADYVANEVICTADSREHAELIAAAYGGTLLEYSYRVATILLDGKSLSVKEAVAAGMDADLNIPPVEPNYIIPVEEPSPVISDNAPALNTYANVPILRTWETWFDGGLFDDPALTDPRNPGYQWMHAMINSYAAWGVTTGDSSIRVAVIDTGVKTDHEDLSGKVNVKNIGRGEIDTGGHGTHVAGIVAAELNNGVGGAGVAPRVSILAIPAANDEGSFNKADIIKAIWYVAGYDQNGVYEEKRRAEIINMSLGGPSYSKEEQDAVNTAYEAGVTICAAMGNESANARAYPAAYDHVIAVSAVNEKGEATGFSNTGAWADIAAPGANIFSTTMNGTNTYASWDGTSMACPVVAGACALYMSAYGYVTPDEMEKVLKRSVNKSPSKQIGAGILDMSKMFSSDTTPPEVMLDRKSAQASVAKSGTTLTVDGTVATDAVITVTPKSANGESTKNGVIIYSVNGKDPAILNGETVNGELYSEEIRVSDLFGAEVTSKKTITFKAACVSGMGVLSKPTTLKITVDPAIPSGITITGASKKLAAGKSVTLSAEITPASASKKVTWEIDADNTTVTGAAISAKGKLTTKAGTPGKLTVKAISTADKSVIGTAEIEVIDVKPVGAIGLSDKAATLEFSRETPSLSAVTELPLEVTTLLDTAGAVKDAEEASLVWTSSNPKVAKVEEVEGEDGRALVTATGKGTANITVKALDGSGKSAVCKITVKQLVEDVDITGQGYVAPGASATYKAAVAPSTANLKTVTWSVTDSLNQPVEGITISNKGVVKVDSDVPTDTVFYVRAIAADNGKAEAPVQKVVVAEKATSVQILEGSESLTTKTMYVSGTPETLNLNFRTSNNSIPLWTTSNAKVATVTQDDAGNATVTAIGKGKAKITCAAQDGSGKKATLSLTVLQPVTDIVLSGQKYIAKGGQATFKVFKILPADASKKTITWSVTDDAGNPVNGITISNKGVVKVAQSATEGDYKVTATATDGYEPSGTGSIVTGSMVFYVTGAKVSKIRISADVATGAHYLPKYNKNGELSSLQLFTVNVGKDLTDETCVFLEAKQFIGDMETGGTPVWTSSKPAVAEISGAGVDGKREGSDVRIDAKAAGTTVITCAAQDGSGTKASVTIKVIVPVSDLHLTAKNGQETYIAFGKSATLQPVAGSLYGKPTNPKVTWDYDIYIQTLITHYDEETGEEVIDGISTDLCAGNDFLKDNKFAKISNGKITAPSTTVFDKYNAQGMFGDWYSVCLKVSAKTTDGTEITASPYWYELVYPTAKIEAYRASNGYYYTVNSINLPAAGERSYTYGYYLDVNEKYNGRYYPNYMYDCAVTSSNANVATAFAGFRDINNDGNDEFAIIVTGHKKGKATLTITARDGTNVKKKIKVNVR